MIDRRILLEHYREYAAQPDGWVANMQNTKRAIVGKVFEHTRSLPKKGVLGVVVLGASDKRYLPIHEAIFTDVTGKPIKMTTLDVDVEHLGGVASVVCHDVATPFPFKADVVFSHELMKFLTMEEQAAAITNAYLALNDGGFAMHVIHEPSIKGTRELREWQHRVDPDYLFEIARRISALCMKLSFKIESSVDWLRETTVIVTER